MTGKQSHMNHLYFIPMNMSQQCHQSPTKVMANTKEIKCQIFLFSAEGLQRRDELERMRELQSVIRVQVNE